MKVDFDFSELNEFAESLNDHAHVASVLGRIAQKIARALVKRMNAVTPVLDYELIYGWDKNKFLVTQTVNGCEVLLVNHVDYALYVNDGHSQRPGRFIPGYWAGVRRFVYVPGHPEGMILKKSWVKGKFFVERGITTLKSSKEIEAIVMQELNKWWESV